MAFQLEAGLLLLGFVWLPIPSLGVGEDSGLLVRARAGGERRSEGHRQQRSGRGAGRAQDRGRSHIRRLTMIAFCWESTEPAEWIGQLTYLLNLLKKK